eukprot:728791_1
MQDSSRGRYRHRYARLRSEPDQQLVKICLVEEEDSMKKIIPTGISNPKSKLEKYLYQSQLDHFQLVPEIEDGEEEVGTWVPNPQTNHLSEKPEIVLILKIRVALMLTLYTNQMLSSKTMQHFKKFRKNSSHVQFKLWNR